MKTYTIEEMFNMLRKECIIAPIDARKIIRAFRDNDSLLHQALHLLAQGKFETYHMIPGNGSKEF